MNDRSYALPGLTRTQKKEESCVQNITFALCKGPG